MTLRKANSLEAENKLLESLSVNINLLEKEQTDSPIKNIVIDNIIRIITKIGRQDSDFLKRHLSNQPELLELTTLRKGDPVSVIEKFKTNLLQPPLVSIVVPCYHCEQLLPATVQSIQAQTWPHFEVVLVDDFSTDNTAAFCKSLTKKDKRFRFYQHRANGGLPVARNSGLRLAKGEFVCFLDSDDLLAPNSIAKRATRLAELEQVQEVLGVFDQSITVPHDFEGMIAEGERKPKLDYVDFVNMNGDCPFNANQPMFKRQPLINLGGFPEKYHQAEDWRLWSKALRAGYVFIPIASIGSGYRQTTNSMIRRAPLEHLSKALSIFLRSQSKWDDEKELIERKYEDYSKVGPLFQKPAGEYEGRHRFVPRLLNFAGIEYARQLETQDSSVVTKILVEKIRELEPLLPLVFTGYSLANASDWFINGVLRYRGIKSLQDDERRELSYFVSELLNCLSVTESALEIGSAKMLIPKRKIQIREEQPIDILFFPHKAYHTSSFKLLLPFLENMGLSYRFVDITVPYRDEQARDKDLEAVTLSYNEFILSRTAPRMILCMNDWDVVVKSVVVKARKQGIPTVGIVEGVQDYFDVDTGRKRNPYQEVEHVFLPGPFDKRYFKDTTQQLYVVGVQRLDGLDAFRTARKRYKTSSSKLAVLNVNFSYGVMTDRREKWVAGVAEACKKAGYHLVISQHPQDDADLSSYKVDSRPLYELLVEADVFISRFSGAILESLAIGCPVIYHNAHGEKIDKFTDTLGALLVTKDAESLSHALSDRKWLLDNVAMFLQEHAGLGLYSGKSTSQVTAEFIREILLRQPVKPENIVEFKRSLVP